MLPADQHVHTQWSADAPAGSMRDACARAIELGLPGITFTDHADHTKLVVSDEAAAYIREIGGTVTGGVFEPQPLDVTGYLQCVEQCRAEFGGKLKVRAGIELGDPHLHPREAAALAGAGFDLIVGSVHSLRCQGGFADAADRYASLPDAEVVREYLAEVTAMVQSPADFAVLAHINYAAGTGQAARAPTAALTSKANTGPRCARSPTAAAPWRSTPAAGSRSTPACSPGGMKQVARQSASAAMRTTRSPSAASSPPRPRWQKPQGSSLAPTGPPCGGADNRSTARASRSSLTTEPAQQGEL
jgi:HisJ family histidinol phosphate phosphatase